MMVAMLKSDLFQRFAGGFVVGAVAIVAVQPEAFLAAIKAAAGIA